MINNISWQGYWITLAITVSFYYAFVAFFYYKAELLHWFSNRMSAKENHLSVANRVKGQTELFSPPALSEEDQDAPELPPVVSSLIDEIQAFFEGTEANQYTKEALLQSLMQLVQKYPGVKGSAYQYSVNNLIQFLSKETSSLQLSVDEINGVWSS